MHFTHSNTAIASKRICRTPTIKSGSANPVLGANGRAQCDADDLNRFPLIDDSRGRTGERYSMSNDATTRAAAPKSNIHHHSLECNAVTDDFDGNATGHAPECNVTTQSIRSSTVSTHYGRTSDQATQTATASNGNGNGRDNGNCALVNANSNEGRTGAIGKRYKLKTFNLQFCNAARPAVNLNIR